MMRRHLHELCACVGPLLMAACPGGGGVPPGTSTAKPSDTALMAAADDVEADAGRQLTATAVKAGERVSVPAGKLMVGSTPGDRGRDPALEPVLHEVEVAAFEMDKLPYPNDPTAPPMLKVSRAEAARMCADGGGRLCGELEWERACKGPEQQIYAGSAAFSSSCTGQPNRCASGYGVLALGFAMREWTSADVLPIRGVQARAAAVRGARAQAADVDHRCAHRAAVAPDVRADDLGFRCCRGPTPEGQIASPAWQAAFRKTEMPADHLARLFASNGRLAPLAKGIKYFRAEPARETVMRRGRGRGRDAGAPPAGTVLTTAPTLWNPMPGELILLVAGRSEKRSFIVAFHRISADRYRVGATFLMEDELGPVVLVYDPAVRRRLHWTTCWECYGDTGNISYRDDHRVVITQR